MADVVGAAEVVVDWMTCGGDAAAAAVVAAAFVVVLLVALVPFVVRVHC